MDPEKAGLHPLERELATKEGVQAAWMVTEDPFVAAFSVRMHVRCAGAHSIACPIHWLSGIPVAWLPLNLDIEEYAHPGAALHSHGACKAAPRASVPNERKDVIFFWYLEAMAVM